MVKVVITDLSNRWKYYQWFLYGFMLLSKQNEISLEFKIPLLQKFLLSSRLYKLANIKKKIYRDIFKHRGEEKTKSLLTGYVERGKYKKYFCIDSADSPFMYHEKLLKEVDVYFKMQYPKEFNKEGFKLGNIIIPWIDNEFQNECDYWELHAPHKNIVDFEKYTTKIAPLLVAIRNMGNSCNFDSMNRFYNHLLESRKIPKDMKAMCYFGNAKGPIQSEINSGIDYDWESDLMTAFSSQLHHPNEKRAKIAAIVGDLGSLYDSRIISLGNSDTKNSTINSVPIPFEKFSSHVARFQYNINISGYRMSIPGRFMDSFICGTGIATDNLHVKWYRDFGPEVQQIGEMGYLPDSQVNYDAVADTLKHLPNLNKDLILENYENFWAPIPAARYIIETALNS